MREKMNRSSVAARRAAILGVAAAAAASFHDGRAFALPYEVDWAGTTGDYNSGSNWGAFTPPHTAPYNRDATDQSAGIDNPFLNIANGGTAQISADAQGAFLMIGMRPTESGTLTISAGTVTLGEMRVGGREVIPDYIAGGTNTPNGGGTGSVVQTGGNVNVTYRDPTNSETNEPIQSLYVGDAGLSSGNTAVGSYTISGGTLLSGIADNDAIEIGNGPGTTGTFTQNTQTGASTVTATGFLRVGRRGGTGTYTMTGGTLNVAQGVPLSGTPTRALWIGDGETAFLTGTSGTFTQSGSSIVTVGDAAINATQNMEIGRRSATGLYDITAGTLTIANGGITVGGGGDTTDPNSQKGVGTLRIGGTAIVNVNDSQTDGGTGDSTTRGNMSIGATGNNTALATTQGTVNVDGGTLNMNDVNGILAVGNGLGGRGTLNVSAGTVNINGVPSTGALPLLDIGRNSSAGLVDVSGTGTINANQLTINSGTPSSGSVTRELRVEGGNLNVKFWEQGSVTPGAGVTRVVNISGGNVTVDNAVNSTVHRGGRVITYNITGGTTSFADIFALDTSTVNVGVSPANNPSVSFATYRIGSGTTRLDSGTLGFTTVNDTGNQGGVWNINGGTLNVSGTFNITSASPGTAGILNLNGGGGTINTLVTGGTTAGSTLYISGGTHAITNLTLSDNGILKTDNTIAKSSNITLNNATVNVNSGSLALSGPIAAAAGKTLTKTGPGTLTLSGSASHPSNTIVNAGTVIAGHAHGIGTGTLTVATGAAVQASAGLPEALQFSSISAAGGGTVDITNNSMVVKGMTDAAVRTQLQAGYNSGAWNGASGIISTAVTPSAATSIGYATQAQTGITSFKGVTGLAGTDVLVKFTYAGDANLDGKVDIGDLGLLAGAWQQASGKVWFDGDFTYDGAVDIGDLGLLSGNWQKGTAGNPSPPLMDFATAMAQFSAFDGVVVPEPASLSVLALAGLALGRRRRQVER